MWCTGEIAWVTLERSTATAFLFSRDVIFHVSDKTTLLNNFYTWLKDNGRLFITDFCCGNTAFSQDLIDYARSGMYTLTSIQEYTDVRGEEGQQQTTGHLYHADSL